MKLLSSFAYGLLLCATAFAVDPAKFSSSVTLSYEIIGIDSSSTNPLATVSYDPVTLKTHLQSWTPPKFDSDRTKSSQPQSSRLLRVVLPNGSSTVTTLATFDNSLIQKIDLWLSPDSNHSILSASISSISPPPLTPDEVRLQRKIERAKAKGKPIPSPKPKPKPKSKKGVTTQQETEDAEKAGSVRINLIIPPESPAPKLSTKKPPQIDAEGREVPDAGEQAEKSFFQKYWWMFLIAAIFTLGANGER